MLAPQRPKCSFFEGSKLEATTCVACADQAAVAAATAGQNQHGQLGVGGTADVAEPQSLKVARRWAALDFGEGHAVGVTGQVGWLATQGRAGRWRAAMGRPGLR